MSTGVPAEELESDEDEERVCVSIPVRAPADAEDIFSIVPTPRYGSNGRVDTMELCGGVGGITRLAVERGLISGGNLDQKTDVDVGNPVALRVATPCIRNCYGEATVLQPNCRSTGLLS